MIHSMTLFSDSLTLPGILIQFFTYRYFWLHSAAAGMWDSCERLSNVSKPTLVITGTQDITSRISLSDVAMECLQVELIDEKPT